MTKLKKLKKRAKKLVRLATKTGRVAAVSIFGQDDAGFVASTSKGDLATGLLHVRSSLALLLKENQEEIQKLPSTVRDAIVNLSKELGPDMPRSAKKRTEPAECP